jgi:hypothetical protein
MTECASERERERDKRERRVRERASDRKRGTEAERQADKGRECYREYVSQPHMASSSSYTCHDGRQRETPYGMHPPPHMRESIHVIIADRGRECFREYVSQPTGREGG